MSGYSTPRILSHQEAELRRLVTGHGYPWCSNIVSAQTLLCTTGSLTGLGLF